MVSCYNQPKALLARSDEGAEVRNWSESAAQHGKILRITCDIATAGKYFRCCGPDGVDHAIESERFSRSVIGQSRKSPSGVGSPLQGCGGKKRSGEGLELIWVGPSQFC